MKLAILVAVLAVQTAPAPAPAPAPPEARGTPRSTSPLPFTPLDQQYAMPNGFTSGPGCRQIVQQVQDEARRNRDDEHRTLDREPPASLLLAVDRHVDGCREVTFVRRNVGSNEQPRPPR